MPIPRPRSIHALEAALAAAVLVAAWFQVDAVAGWPNWLALGPVSLPTAVLPPAALSLAVLADLRHRHRRGERHPTRLAIGALAGLTLLVSAYAVADLNIGRPGVFWAGLLPLAAGVVLALVVLPRAALALAGAGR